jgi:hypothetical protein
VSVDPAIRRELCDLLGQLRDGRIDPRGLARLDAIVTADPSARRLYLAYVELCASLHWAQNSRNGECGMVNDEPSETTALGSAAPAIHHSSFTVHHLSALSYAMASLLLGAMIAAAWAWKLPRGPSLPAAGPATIEVVQTVDRAAGPRTPVGKITRTIGCRWTNMMITKETGAEDRLVVALGARYIVDAGLLEITYYSGAKVVIEGPAVYEVDGCNGGFLRVGAATFLCKTPTDQTGARAASPASEPADQQFFCVHVPGTGVPDRLAIRLQDVDLSLKVDEHGDLSTRALSPAVASITPGIASHAAPNNPSATVGVDANGRPFLIVMKRPPAAKQGLPTPNATAVSSSDPKDKKKKKG